MSLADLQGTYDVHPPYPPRDVHLALRLSWPSYAGTLDIHVRDLYSDLVRIIGYLARGDLRGAEISAELSIPDLRRVAKTLREGPPSEEEVQRLMERALAEADKY